MKNRYKIKLAVSLLVLVAMLGCEDFNELNQNPDTVTSNSVDPNKQLTYVQLALSGGRYEQWRANAIYSMGFTQQITGSWGFSRGGYYVKNDGYMEAQWNAQYPREVKEVVDIIGNTEGDPSKTNINALARIMRVFIFHRLTDLYGDVPYFDAGQAFYKQVFTAKYDRQEDIYMDFFNELDIALAALDVDGDIISGDLFLEGDIVKWQRFANSLRLRLALRLHKVNPTKAQEEAQKAVSGKGGLMSGLGDEIVTYHEEAPFYNSSYLDLRGNGLSQVFDAGSESAYLSAPIVDYMKSVSDPKLTMLGRVYNFQILKWSNFTNTELTDLTIAAEGADRIMGMDMGPAYEFVIEPYTLEQGGTTYQMTNITAPLQIAKEFRRLDAPFTHMTYAETELLLAEAITRGYVNGQGTAQEHFNKGMEASVNHLVSVYGCEAPPLTAMNTYLENELESDQILALEQINSQLWVAHILNGIEAYANWRRSGFPHLEFVQNVENQATIIPRRFYYPIGEQSTNTDNWKEAVERFPNQIDDWENRVWWDVE